MKSAHMNNCDNNTFKYAIFGGSFDPIHIGHLKLAKAAAEECGLDKLYLMANYISPFKLDREVTATEDRVAMVKASLGFCEAFDVSTYEVNREKPSYTIETLEYFDENYEGKLYFVLGFDSVLDLEKWHRGPEIISKYPLITGRRPGTGDESGFSKIEEYREKYNADITVLDIEPFDASSTEIRERIRNNASTEGLLIPEVKEYITEHGLYR